MCECAAYGVAGLLLIGAYGLLAVETLKRRRVVPLTRLAEVVHPASGAGSRDDQPRMRRRP